MSPPSFHNHSPLSYHRPCPQTTLLPRFLGVSESQPLAELTSKYLAPKSFDSRVWLWVTLPSLPPWPQYRCISSWALGELSLCTASSSITGHLGAAGSLGGSCLVLLDGTLPAPPPQLQKRGSRWGFWLLREAAGPGLTFAGFTLSNKKGADLIDWSQKLPLGISPAN